MYVKESSRIVNNEFYLNMINSFVTEGDGRVVGWCWVNFQYRGVPLIWVKVRQRSIAHAVGAGWAGLDIFLSSIISHFFIPLSGRRPDID